MKNKLFSAILWLFFSITSLFLVCPLAMLVIRGAAYIFPCFQSEEVRFSILLSMRTTLLSTLICMVFSLPTSLVLHNHDFPFKRLIMQILNLPMALPHLVSGIALLLFFGKTGIGNPLFEWFHLDFIFTKQGIVLAQTFVNLPLTIKMLYTALEEGNDKMLFVARTLGCSKFQSFWYITLPSLKCGIASATVMTWSRALGEFGAVVMIAGSTRMKTEILPTAIFLNMSTGDLDTAMGIAVILIAISLLCMFVFELLLNRRIKS